MKITTDTSDLAGSPYAEDFAALEPIKADALARGAEPDLVNYLATSAAMQRYVSRHNARAGYHPPLEYGSYEEFTLRHGQSFPKPAVARPKGLRKGRDKGCFRNAALAAIDHERDGWQYVEGYGSGFIPAHHAWCLDGDGNVVETTWREAGSNYLGIVFPHEVWRMAIVTTGTYGVFGVDLLTQPYTPEAFMDQLRSLRAQGSRRSRR